MWAKFQDYAQVIFRKGQITLLFWKGSSFFLYIEEIELEKNEYASFDWSCSIYTCTRALIYTLHTLHTAGFMRSRFIYKLSRNKKKSVVSKVLQAWGETLLFDFFTGVPSHERSCCNTTVIFFSCFPHNKVSTVLALPIYSMLKFATAPIHHDYDYKTKHLFILYHGVLWKIKF